MFLKSNLYRSYHFDHRHYRTIFHVLIRTFSDKFLFPIIEGICLLKGFVGRGRGQIVRVSICKTNRTRYKGSVKVGQGNIRDVSIREKRLEPQIYWIISN